MEAIDTSTTIDQAALEGLLGHKLPAKVEWVYLPADDRLFHRDGPGVWREFRGN